MKKLIGFLTAFAILITSVSYVNAATQVQATERPDYMITMDGMPAVKDSEGLVPLVYKDRTYLPLRYITQLLSLSIAFDADSKTISLSSARTDNEMLQLRTEMAKQKESYEQKIADLEAQIKKLEDDKKNEVTSEVYQKFPQTAARNGYKLTVSDLGVFDSRKEAYLYFKLENVDSNEQVKLSPMDTKIIINGEEYEPNFTVKGLDADLFKWLSKGEDIEKNMFFLSLPESNEIKNIEVIMSVERNQFNPVKESFTFKGRIN